MNRISRISNLKIERYLLFFVILNILVISACVEKTKESAEIQTPKEIIQPIQEWVQIPLGGIFEIREKIKACDKIIILSSKEEYYQLREVLEKITSAKIRGVGYIEYALEDLNKNGTILIIPFHMGHRLMKESYYSRDREFLDRYLYDEWSKIVKEVESGHRGVKWYVKNGQRVLLIEGRDIKEIKEILKETLGSEVPSPIHEGYPANIKKFDSAKEGDIIRFYFRLEDKNGWIVQSDGNVDLEIFDRVGNSLYHNKFDIKASEFVDYIYPLTGQKTGKAYGWRVPISEIKKGVSSIGYGIAVLIFTTPQGIKLKAMDKMVPIPTYTEDELKQMTEEEYEKKATIVNQKISKGSFEVTVTKAGFFTSYKWDKKKQYFRVDMEVKNIGSKAKYFSPSGMVIIDGQGNQYEKTYGGTLDTFSKIYPGITKKGYILFENVPTSITSVKLMFELGYDENFNPCLFEYTINLK